MQTTTIELQVNGEGVKVETRPSTSLLSVLRDQLRLVAAKEACGRGECGACTVLVGGRSVNACVTLAQRVDAPVETLEGVCAEISDLRWAFAQRGAFQCGYCTPGQLVRACCLLRGDNPPTGSQLRHAMAGNICRCTGYGAILAAIEDVVASRSGTSPTAEAHGADQNAETS